MSDPFTTEAFSLLGVGIFVIALRSYARITSVGFRGLQFDDYLMCVAAVRIADPLVLVFANPVAGHILPRDGSSIHRRRMVPRSRKQWHDRRTAKDTRSRVARALASSGWVEDAAGRLESLHASAVDPEVVHVSLLLKADVSNAT